MYATITTTTTKYNEKDELASVDIKMMETFMINTLITERN
jgi:hypothetical protein